MQFGGAVGRASLLLQESVGGRIGSAGVGPGSPDTWGSW